MQKNQVFCKAPWISLQNDPQGWFNVCCMYEDYSGVGKVEDGWKTAWTGSRMNEIREGFLKKDSKYTDYCKHCVLYEKFGSSQRLGCEYYAKQAGDLGLEESIKRGPVFLDIRFSTKCNCACIMCGVHASSRWSKELGYPVPVFDFSSLVDLVRDNLDHVQRIHFAGGEPLIVDEHYQILKLLKEAGRSDVHISYNTNLSTLKYKDYDVLDLWNYFTNVGISVSIDAVEEKNDYIRYGNNWKNFTEHCRCLVKNPNWHVSFHPTLQVLNVAEVPKMYEYVNSFGDPTFHLDWGNFLDHPEELDIRRLPVEVRQKIVDLVPDISSEDLKQNWQIIRSEVLKPGREVDGAVKIFTNYMKKIDNRRGTSWIQTFPEVAKILGQ